MRRVQWALRSLARYRARVVLAILGISVAAAMLLDMVMLGGGMTVSFRSLLESQGFALRMAPRGTLPFDSEATVPGADALRQRLLRYDGIQAVGMVLGAQLRVERGDSAVTAAGLGVDPNAQVDYRIVEGRDLAADDEILASPVFLRRTGAQVGDTLTIAAGYDPQLRTYTGRRVVTVVAEVRFTYLPADQPAVALLLPALQAMGGDATRNRFSLGLLRVAPGVDVDALAAAIDAAEPSVSVISTAEALRAVEERLSYFRQLAVILGTVSLVVGFLLTTTIVTVGVNERLGEIAVLRAIGTSKQAVIAQVVAEGALLGTVGAIGGLVLGLATAQWLNAILGDFPGLPASFDFFVFRARDAFTSLGLLALCGTLAGIVPAWRAASLPIARTLREDAVV
jgi:putative ABC transport system permease protein